MTNTLKKNFVRRAAVAFHESRYEDALDLYRKAAFIIGEKNLRANIILCEMRLGKSINYYKDDKYTSNSINIPLIDAVHSTMIEESAVKLAEDINIIETSAMCTVEKSTEILPEKYCLTKTFLFQEEILIRQDNGKFEIVELTEKALWINLVVAREKLLVVGVRMQCNELDPVCRPKSALVIVEFINANGNKIAPKCSMPFSENIGYYFYLPADEEQAALFTLTLPYGCNKIRLGFRKWGSDAHVQVSNLVGVSRIYPGISVIVPSFMGASTIELCLSSLNLQIINKKLFEIIVIINGERDESYDIVCNFKSRYPEVNINLLTLDEASVSSSRNYGIHQACREYITFIDDDDTVSPDYLGSLLTYAGSDRIVLAQILDIKNGGIEDNIINRQIVSASAVKCPSYDDVTSAMTMNACKLVSSYHAKQVAFDAKLRSGEDVDYWLRFVSRFMPTVKIIPISCKAIYYRLIRNNSVSRQPLSFDFNVQQRIEVIRKIDAELFYVTDNKLKNFIKSKIRAQAGFIINYLRENPNEFLRFIDQVVKVNFSYPVKSYINSKIAETLVFSYCFPPYIDTAGIVAAKRIHEVGVPVNVISNCLSKIRPLDSRLRVIVDNFLGEAIELTTPPSFANWRAIEMFCDAALKAAIKMVTNNGKFKKIYSRAMWPASHFAAAAYKALHPDVIWTAEFSDPMLLDIHGQVRSGELRREWLEKTGISSLIEDYGYDLPESNSLFYWCEQLPYLLADQIIFTNENQMNYMLSYIDSKLKADVIRKKSVIKPQPTLPKKYYQLVQCPYAVNNSFINIGYFGSFYDTRGLSEAFEALRGLPDDKRDRIRFHIFTEQGEKIENDTTINDLKINIVLNRYVGYLEFLNLSTKFDCLIVNDAETKGLKSINPYLPSKLSDYIGSDCPVWAICESGSSMHGIHQSGYLKYYSEVGRINEHQSVLLNLLSA